MSAGVKERKFTGRHMLILLLAFFGVIIAVNLTMAVMATRSWTGLVAKNGYVASIDYAADAEARRAAAARGWTLALTAPDGYVTLDARNAHGEALGLATVPARAVREVSRDDAHPFVLGPVAPGRWRAEAALPAGTWSVTASIADGADTVEWRRVLVVGDAQ